MTRSRTEFGRRSFHAVACQLYGTPYLLTAAQPLVQFRAELKIHLFNQACMASL